jgi:hypothetical protein
MMHKHLSLATILRDFGTSPQSYVSDSQNSGISFSDARIALARLNKMAAWISPSS